MKIQKDWKSVSTNQIKTMNFKAIFGCIDGSTSDAQSYFNCFLLEANFFLILGDTIYGTGTPRTYGTGTYRYTYCQ